VERETAVPNPYLERYKHMMWLERRKRRRRYFEAIHEDEYERPKFCSGDEEDPDPELGIHEGGRWNPISID
jgi:hypothetical protein